MVRYIPHYTSILSWFPSSFLVATIKVTLGLSKGPSDLPFLFLFIVISLRCVLFFPCSLYTYIYMCVYICVCVCVVMPGGSVSSILAWKIPWTEELGGIQSMGLQKNWTHTKQLHTHTHTHNINTCIHMHAYIYIYMNMYLYILLKIVTFKWLYAMAALKKLLLLHFVIEKD